MKDFKFKKNDVFSFVYSDPTVSRHCFDGTLIVRELPNGELYLEDTYWATGDNKRFSIDEANKKGELTFICNLDEVDPIEPFMFDYYDDCDTITLRIHGGYRNKYFLKKGSLKSQSKMIKVLMEKIECDELEIEHAKFKIKSNKRKLEEIKKGNIDVYL